MVLLKFETLDGIIEVDGELLQCSAVLQDMLECCSNDDEYDIIPLSHTSSSIMKLVIEWTTHYKDDSLFAYNSTNDNQYIEIVPDWDNNFFGSMDNETLYGVILLADFLHITKLFKHITKFVANMLDNAVEFSDLFNATDTTSSNEESNQKKQKEESKRPTKKRVRNQEKNVKDRKVKRKKLAE